MNLLFPEGLYRSIERAIEDRHEFLVGRRDIDELGGSVLAKVIDIAYSASLMTEEGRPIACSLLLLPSDGRRPASAQEFAQALEFSDRNIRKLALAFNPTRSALLVEFVSGGLPCKIIGSASFTRSGRELSSLPVNTKHHCSWPDALVIRIDGPATLSIGIGMARVGTFEAGRFSRAITDPLSSHVMGKHVRDLLAGDPQLAAFREEHWSHYRRSVGYLLRRVRESADGATIVITAAGRNEIASELRDGYFYANFSGIEPLFTDYFNAEEENEIVQAAILQRVEERLDELAAFANVDGALVLTPRLSVVAFGAKINSRAWAHRPTIALEGSSLDGQDFELERHGTRHTSAVNIVGALPRTVAFVASSDGPVRGFALHAATQTMQCWPDLRASMRLDK